MTVAVLADSAASLPADVAATWGIAVVPLQVIVDTEAYAEGVDITAAEVVAHLEQGAPVGTSQPTPAAFDHAIEAAVKAGAAGIVLVTMSGRLSGTHAAACAAADRADIPVEVVDTRTVAMASGFAAIAAAQAAGAGRPLAEVAQVARDVAAQSRCLFTVDSLEHMRRGGRVSSTVATVGRVLGIRPVLEIVDGEVVLAARVRGLARARAALLAAIDEALAVTDHPAVAVMSVGAPDEASRLAVEIVQRHPAVGTVTVCDVSAVLAVHVGPGTVAAVVTGLPPAS